MKIKKLLVANRGEIALRICFCRVAEQDQGHELSAGHEAIDQQKFIAGLISPCDPRSENGDRDNVDTKAGEE